jgi:hypothetical protein
MIRCTWAHLTSDVIIEVVAWRTGLSVSACACFYELVLRDMGMDLFVEVFEGEIDNI